MATRNIEPALALYTESPTRIGRSRTSSRWLPPPIESGSRCDRSSSRLPASPRLVLLLMRRTGGRTILFGGDLGRYGEPGSSGSRDPIPRRTCVLLESTYGDRDHVAATTAARSLPQVVSEHGKARRTRRSSPPLPSDASKNCSTGFDASTGPTGFPAAGVVDSPMADRRLAVLRRARPTSSTPTCARPRSGVSTFAPPAFTRSPRRSNRMSSTASSRRSIVISSSGMATGGRVLHHLAARPARPSQHRALRRLPGGRDARPRCSWTVSARCGFTDEIPVGARIVEDRLDVGARRPGRNPALAERQPGGPRPAVPGARRARADGRAQSLIEQRLGWPAYTPAHRETITL